MAWMEAAHTDTILPGKATFVNLKDKEIGLFHENGEYYAVLNYCPHFGAPVCAGKVFQGCVTASGTVGEPLGFDPNRSVLRCPWHHWEFDLASGKALAPIRQRLRTYPVRVEDGALWVDI